MAASAGPRSVSRAGRRGIHCSRNCCRCRYVQHRERSPRTRQGGRYHGLLAPRTTPRTSTTSYPLWTIDHGTIGKLVERGGIVAPKGPPGSMILFHGCLVHASTANLSPWDRWSVYLSLCAVSNHIRRFKRPGYIAHRDFSPIQCLPDDCLLRDYDVPLPWKDGTPEAACPRRARRREEADVVDDHARPDAGAQQRSVRHVEELVARQFGQQRLTTS